jgi:hypothetical protein
MALLATLLRQIEVSERTAGEEAIRSPPGDEELKFTYLRPWRRVSTAAQCLRHQVRDVPVCLSF